MKKLTLTVLAVSLLGRLALAQDAPAADVPIVDVAAAYSFFYVLKGFTLAMNGGSASVALNANRWLGVVGDFGEYQATPGSGTGLTCETYTLGPRFSYRKQARLTPFAQVLLGGGHASAVSGGFTAKNAFAIGAGGGADLAIDRAGQFALRPQLDYFDFRATGDNTNIVRLSVGLVFHIGKW